MGYTTDFEGEFELSRELTVREYNLLKELHETRHGGNISHDPAFPGMYCQWEPDEDGTHIRWDGGEKFYDYVEWMNYIIDRFLTPWGITVSGKVHYQGESIGDHGYLVIKLEGCPPGSQNGRCVQVSDAEVGDMAEQLETYVQELNGPDPCRLIPVGEVIDRLSTILYGEKG